MCVWLFLIVVTMHDVFTFYLCMACCCCNSATPTANRSDGMEEKKENLKLRAQVRYSPRSTRKKLLALWVFKHLFREEVA